MMMNHELLNFNYIYKIANKIYNKPERKVIKNERNRNKNKRNGMWRV